MVGECLKNVTTKDYSLYNGDCVELTQQMPDNSVHFEIFSPPFANLYIYSDDLRDMGNCKNEDEFFEQFDYLIPHLWRVLMPGRLCAVHCKQIARYKTSHGASGWYDFRGDIIRHFEKAGFQYHSEFVIWTDPVLEMQKTKTQRLLYCQLQRDASLSGAGMPEYLVIFRKWDEAHDDEHEPVKHYKNLQEAKKAGANENQVLDLETWQKYASPVWFDIRRTDVLNVKIAREDRDEKHLCPLSLEIIRRAVKLYTNPGEIVYSPFGGIGSEPYISLELGRRAVAVELKESYFNQMVANCQSVLQKDQITLFEE